MKFKRPTTPTGYTYDPTTGATRSRLTRREMTVSEMALWYGYWLVVWVIPYVLIVGGGLLGWALTASGKDWAKVAGTLLYIVVVGAVIVVVWRAVGRLFDRLAQRFSVS